MSIKKIIRDVRVQILGVLILLWIAAILKQHSWQAFFYPLYSVILFTLLDLSLTYVKVKKLYYPFSSVVSGLIIGFLIHVSAGISALTAAVLLAFVSKQFLKIKNRHIFNPAAFGLAATAVIFGSTVSWWAVASGETSFVLLLPAILILYKLRRLQYTVIFIAGYFIFFTLLQGLKAASALTLDGTVFFFTAVMLTEPMTSSITRFWKWGFALIVLTGVIVNYFLKLSFADPLLLSLLFANLLVRIAAK